MPSSDVGEPTARLAEPVVTVGVLAVDGDDPQVFAQ